MPVPLLAAVLRPPSFMACQCGHPDVVVELLDAGAYTGPQGRHGFTPLIKSAHMGHVEVVKVLLRRGCPTETKNDQGFTALHMASAANNIDVMQELLRAGANPKARGPQNYTPFTLACQEGHPEAKILLAQYGGGIQDAPRGATPLHLYVMANDFKGIRSFLRNGRNPDVLDGEGLTPLHRAAMNVSPRGVSEMLRGGADDTMRFPPWFGGERGAVTTLTFTYMGLARARSYTGPAENRILTAGVETFTHVRDALLRGGAFRGAWRWPVREGLLAENQACGTAADVMAKSGENTGRVSCHVTMRRLPLLRVRRVVLSGMTR